MHRTILTRTTIVLCFLLAPAASRPAHALNVEWDNTFGSRGQAAGQFNIPAGGAVDAQGNYHITDNRGGRVVVFDKTGKFQREYGTNSTPKLARPWGIAISPATGKIFVADNDQHLLFVFAPDGKLIETLGGRGSNPGSLRDPQGVAIRHGGRVYVADTGNGRISVFGEDGLFLGVFGPESKGTGATLKKPVDVAVDPEENIYVADSGLREVVIFNRDWRRLTKIGRDRGFSEPAAVATDANGTVAMLDADSQRIFHFAPGQKPLQTFGSSGSAQAQFRSALGLVFDDVNGRFVVVDTGNQRVQTFRHRDREGQTPRPNYRPEYTLEFVRSITVKADDIDVGDGKIFALDSRGKTIRVLTTEGAAVNSIALKWESKDAVEDPANILYHAGTVYVTDRGAHDVKMFDAGGTFKGRMGARGSAPGQLRDPRGMFASDRFLFIVDRGNDRVSLFSPNGGFVTINQSKGSGALSKPVDLVADADGNLYVLDEGPNRLMKYSQNSQFLNALCRDGYGPGSLDRPAAIEMDRMEMFYILDRNGISIVDKECKPMAGFGGGIDGKGKGRYTATGGLAVDDSKGTFIYFSDPANDAIQVVTFKQTPSAAVGLTLTTGREGATLSWTGTAEAFRQAWEIQGAAKPEGPFTKIADAKQPPFELKYPVENDPTCFRVVARSFSGVESTPSNVVIDIFRQANLLFAARQFDVALARADEHLAGYPDQPDALFLKARSLVELKRAPEAAEIFRKLAQVEGYGERALEELGRIYLADAKYKEAGDIATQLLTLNDLSVAAHKMLATVALETGQLDDAIAKSSRAAAINANDTEALDIQARAYLKKGLPGEAIKIYTNALKINKTDPVLYIGLSSALISIGQPAQAVPYLQWVVKQQPDNIRSRELLARALLAAKQPSAALEQAEAVKRLGPEQAVGHELAGFAARDLNDMPKAILELEQAARKEPQNPRYQIQLGLLYRAANRPGDANLAFQKAIALTPNTAPERRVLADQLFQAQLYPLATVEYDNVFRLDPKQTDAVLLSAESYYLSNRMEPARNAYLKALDVNPNAGLAHYRLGSMHMSAKEYEQAVPRFLLASRIEPAQHAYHAMLGDAYMGLGDAKSATDAYRTATEIEPGNATYQAKYGQAKAKYDAAPYERTGPLEIVNLTIPDLVQSAFEQYRQSGALEMRFSNRAGEDLYQVKVKFQVPGLTAYPYEDQLTVLKPKDTQALTIKPRFNQAALDLPGDTFAVASFEISYYFQKRVRTFNIYRSLLIRADLSKPAVPPGAVPSPVPAATPGFR
ncbi:MAG: tetratricopeptide repeat protein [Deltaproteobacteria bacterium]|nr:tetratricopeptide repeat protein [Deltaproteobacteria bacterium]